MTKKSARLSLAVGGERRSECGSVSFVSGFEIRIDLGLPILALLLTWSLARSVFPAYSKGRPSSTDCWTGVAGALDLLASVAVHELSHSLVARRFMKSAPVSVPSHVSVEPSVEDTVCGHRVPMYPALDEGRLSGCVTTREAAEASQRLGTAPGAGDGPVLPARKHDLPRRRRDRGSVPHEPCRNESVAGRGGESARENTDPEGPSPVLRPQGRSRGPSRDGEGNLDGQAKRCHLTRKLRTPPTGFSPPKSRRATA